MKGYLGKEKWPPFVVGAGLALFFFFFPKFCSMKNLANFAKIIIKN